jgi:hypothetical protein
MITKTIVVTIGLILIIFLYLVHNAMIKPIYNKMHNMWQDDPDGRQYAHFALIVMLLIAFMIGLFIV